MNNKSKIITLKEYKSALINKFKTNDIKEIEKRKKFLNIDYKDELFINAINGTYTFAYFLSNIKNKDYYEIELLKKEQEISVHVSGGFPSDILYTDTNSNIISDYILKYILGSQLNIEYCCEDVITQTKGDLVLFEPHYSLYIDGFPKNMNEIKVFLEENKKYIKRK